MKPANLLCLAVVAVMTGHTLAAERPQTPPDLTKGEMTGVDRKGTYNLGSTGMRGWIFLKPATHFDGLQGRTTAPSRQILVTHVGVKSPADDVMQVDDVILGAGGKSFTDDARKSIAVAIQEAEKEANQGVLKLTRWRAGKTEEVQLKLRVMGTYSDTAPYGCPKSTRIFEEACKALDAEKLDENWHGAISGLALLATGNTAYLPKLQAYARKLGPPTLKLKAGGLGAWEGGYRTMFLCEYFLATGDPEVLPAIREFTLSLAKGQGMYGTFGHGYSALTPDGKLHGAIPPYGPVNQAGLPANIGIILGRKCGVKDPEVDAAIDRAAKFFGYFTDKGTIPYGEHEPYPYHDNNGKSAMSAFMFSLLSDRANDARFFAKMATAGFRNRECGHTGQGFSYLWGAPGANVGGPAAVAAFFKEASWHFDLVRRSDGSFTYDGGEQYGPGRTEDDTYYGKSSYSGLSPNATYVLTYALPLKKIFLTGRAAPTALWLNQKEVAEVVASGRFDLDRLKRTPAELVAAFNDWSPIVRGWAAEDLARRPEAALMTAQLIAMAEGPNARARQGAAEALGILKSVDAQPALIRLLAHEDRWLRFKAAEALKKMGSAAKPAVPDILTAVAQTTELLQPINWADPVQLTHGQLAAALFSGPMADSLRAADPKLLYPAIRAIAGNADGMARAKLRGFFEHKLSLDDVLALAPDIYAAVKTPSPADTMFSNEIRMGGFKALTKYKFKEGIDAGVMLAKTQGGHGSEKRTGEIMKEIIPYGTAARSAIPGLKELIAQFNEDVANRKFPGGELNQMRVTAVEDAIKAIETATTQPEIRSASADAAVPKSGAGQ
jgi:hypothetical protein